MKKITCLMAVLLFSITAVLHGQPSSGYYKVTSAATDRWKNLCSNYKYKNTKHSFTTQNTASTNNYIWKVETSGTTVKLLSGEGLPLMIIDGTAYESLTHSRTVSGSYYFSQAINATTDRYIDGDRTQTHRALVTWTEGGADKADNRWTFTSASVSDIYTVQITKDAEIGEDISNSRVTRSSTNEIAFNNGFFDFTSTPQPADFVASPVTGCVADITIDEVQKLIKVNYKDNAVPVYSLTYKYVMDGVELFSEVHSAEEGAVFPAVSSLIPFYMEYSVEPALTGTVSEDATFTITTTPKAGIPFKFSKTLESAQWVSMKVLYSKNLPGRPSEGAVNYDAANWITNANPYVGITKDASTAENYANYMWAFVGDWYHGYKIYSYADKAKMWGYGKDGFITDNNIHDRAIQLYDSEVNENLRTWQIVKWQGTDGADNYAEETYSLVLVNTDHPNFYAGEHLAADQYKLGTWMTSTTGNTAAHNRIAIADPLPIYTAYAQTVLAEAGKVGYPKTTSGGATQLKSALTSATTFSELYGCVENFRSENDVVLPTDGKAYILKAHFTGSDKYVALGSEALTTSETEGATFICHQLDNGKFVFVNNNGTFFNKVGNFTAYSNLTEFTLLHSYGDVAQTYGTFGMQAHDSKFLTVNGTSFQQGYEGIAETSTSAFYLEETTYANNPAMTTAQGIDEEKKIATFSAPFAFTLPAGIDAYIVKQTKTDGTASLTKLASEGEVVAAHTGVILLGTTAESNVLMIPATTTGVTDAESMLGNTAGAPKDIVSAGNNYILAKNGEGYIIFSKALEGANGKNLAMNKAYLTVPGGSTSQFKIDFGGTTTAIETIATEGNNNSAAVYDLSGRRVSTPAHRGVYIRNGKKFMVK